MSCFSASTSRNLESPAQCLSKGSAYQHNSTTAACVHTVVHMGPNPTLCLWKGKINLFAHPCRLRQCRVRISHSAIHGFCWHMLWHWWRLGRRAGPAGQLAQPARRMLPHSIKRWLRVARKLIVLGHCTAGRCKQWCRQNDGGHGILHTVDNSCIPVLRPDVFCWLLPSLLHRPTYTLLLLILAHVEEIKTAQAASIAKACFEKKFYGCFQPPNNAQRSRHVPSLGGVFLGFLEGVTWPGALVSTAGGSAPFGGAPPGGLASRRAKNSFMDCSAGPNSSWVLMDVLTLKIPITTTTNQSRCSFTVMAHRQLRCTMHSLRE